MMDLIFATKHVIDRYRERAHHPFKTKKEILNLLFEDFLFYYNRNGFRIVEVDDGKLAYITPGNRVFIVGPCDQLAKPPGLYIITYMDCGCPKAKASLTRQIFYNSWLRGYFD